jgi:hypothetical protein
LGEKVSTFNAIAFAPIGLPPPYHANASHGAPEGQARGGGGALPSVTSRTDGGRAPDQGGISTL